MGTISISYSISPLGLLNDLRFRFGTTPGLTDFFRFFSHLENQKSSNYFIEIDAEVQ